MDGVTIEKAEYIITHYPALLIEQEGMALKHHRYTVKLSETNDTGLTRMYLKTGRLTSDPLILNYLKDGYAQFALNCAGRIMTECPGKAFFNYCPNCSKLARTPQAKQGFEIVISQITSYLSQSIYSCLIYFIL